MGKEELHKLFQDALQKTVMVHTGDDSIHTAAFFVRLYCNMWNDFPNAINLDTDGLYLNKELAESQAINIDDDEYDEDEEEETYYTFNSVVNKKTFIALVDHYRENNGLIYRFADYPIIITADKKIIFMSDYNGITVLQEEEFLSDEFIKLVYDEDADEDLKYFTYITNSNNGFNETRLKVKKFDIDLKSNYNDDLPDEKIKDFLKGNKSGLLLLHGIPGSGKTYYIRHLINEIHRPFIVLDKSMFACITDASFIDILINNRNAVIILEDCEDMLVDRATGNAEISTLLNLSDGVIGDSFNFKFICTFNANVSSLDKALLRKGRLHLKYEFKELTPDKVKALAEKLGKDIKEIKTMSLSDVFNYEIDTGIKERKKVGF